MTRFLLCDVKWPHDLRNMWLFKWEPLALRLMLWSWRLYVLWDWRCSTFILSRNITWLHDQKFMWLGKLPMSQVWYLQVLWKWRYSAFFVMRHHKITWSKGHVTWYVGAPQLEGALKVLRQFLTTESPLKIMKNAFCFTLKALFVLKIFRFLFRLFAHVEKRLD